MNSLKWTKESLKKFPLIQLPRKSEANHEKVLTEEITKFPLIQLPRKSEEYIHGFVRDEKSKVSINSTSEEVRSSKISNV